MDIINCTAEITQPIFPIPFDVNNLLICVIITIAMQLSFFIIAYACRFDEVTDFAECTNFVILALVTFALARTFTIRQILVTVCVTIWGIRLFGYQLYRIIKIGKDKQFDGNIGSCLKLGACWMCEVYWVCAASLPVIFTNAPASSCVNNLPNEVNLTGNVDSFTVLDLIGTITFTIGLLIETTADFQKFSFINNPENEEKWCDTGLWRYSRHPNYFGELMVWYSVFLISCNVLRGGMWILAVLGLWIDTSILLGERGIPIQERIDDWTHGHNEQYRQYKNSTSPLILLPPYCYRRLPAGLKYCACAEYPCYNHLDRAEEERLGSVQPQV